MGQSRASALPPFTAEEVAAAEAILTQVQGLRDALHQLEYLTRLPHLITQEQERLQAVQVTLQALEQDIRAKTTQLAELQQQSAQREREMSGAEDQLRSLQAVIAREETRLADLRRMREAIKAELREELAPET